MSRTAQPILARPGVGNFQAPLSQATEGRQKGKTCFGRWLAALTVCSLGQGCAVTQVAWGVGKGGWDRMALLSLETPRNEGSCLALPSLSWSSFARPLQLKRPHREVLPSVYLASCMLQFRLLSCIWILTEG